MIYNCYFCQSELIKHTCLKCPIKVIHHYSYSPKRKIFFVELCYGGYRVDIYINPDEDFPMENCIISDKDTLTVITKLPRNPNITPTNIKEKLQTILTFQ
jgi:hypothetical protein